MSLDSRPRASWRSRFLVLLHFGYWMLEWISNTFHFLWFLVRRRKIQAEMRDLIVTGTPKSDSIEGGSHDGDSAR